MPEEDTAYDPDPAITGSGKRMRVGEAAHAHMQKALADWQIAEGRMTQLYPQKYTHRLKRPQKCPTSRYIVQGLYMGFQGLSEAFLACGTPVGIMESSYEERMQTRSLMATTGTMF